MRELVDFIRPVRSILINPLKSLVLFEDAIWDLGGYYDVTLGLKVELIKSQKNRRPLSVWAKPVKISYRIDIKIK